MWITVLQRDRENVTHPSVCQIPSQLSLGMVFLKNEHGTHAEGKSDDGGAATDRDWVSNATNRGR